MTKPFPETLSFSGYNAPSRVEADVFDLEIHGELPAEISGCWFRMTPDPQYPPRLGDDIFISGDGMISCFRFENGHVDYKSRYVRTERFLAERKARRGLFGAYRNRFTDDPEAAGVDRTVANTSPVWHGGRLFAIKEDGLPYEIDPVSLDTKGRYDWGGKLRTQTVSAHPKIDPKTGELLFYGYEASGDATRDMAFCVADADGKLVSEEWFEAPYAGMVHDFAITEDYVVFPIFPTLTDLDRMKAGGPHWMSDISLDAYVGVIPRQKGVNGGGVKDLRWFRRPRRPGLPRDQRLERGRADHDGHLRGRDEPLPLHPRRVGHPLQPTAGRRRAPALDHGHGRQFRRHRRAPDRLRPRRRAAGGRPPHRPEVQPAVDGHGRSDPRLPHVGARRPGLQHGRAPRRDHRRHRRLVRLGRRQLPGATVHPPRGPASSTAMWQR